MVGVRALEDEVDGVVLSLQGFALRRYPVMRAARFVLDKKPYEIVMQEEAKFMCLPVFWRKECKPAFIQCSERLHSSALWLMRANSVYTDTGVRITDDIDDAGFAVLSPLFSVTWDFGCQYNNSNIPDSCGLF